MNKPSKQRKAIIRILKNTVSHSSAEEIYEQVKREVPGIGLATVYRNLRILKESGQVIELHGANNTARFDGNTGNHHHFHCDRCRKIIDLYEPDDIAVQINLAMKAGIKVTRCNLLLSGLCLDCQKLETRERKK